MWWFWSEGVDVDDIDDEEDDDDEKDDNDDGEDDDNDDDNDDDLPWIVMVSPSCRIVLLFPEHSPGFARTEIWSLLAWISWFLWS